ncbi:hypothetical protein [Burkholderia cenocepacia]|uniref:hypothetical protein n=1 Tax=Burkholderia cenocepacia TaxID=95486 RepID=UPI00222FE261|nr:hypothetical protein [Burkholderia cenocepacia]MCW3498648.1 hypothetical protein [Burkholderia cenocepacia]MCW3506264.1 hypothetical protein [Burkholderia cenocepacia]MCW3513801.1 hypothetical protein [Burkholderia cenocepacia]MCW3528951.1 hypothetical protein [Burkholderia cenocepacia]MCW3544715.1 hypothetical protein [Burkholderia cenocepacia]
MEEQLQTKEDIKQWLDEMNIKKYVIHDDMTVRVNGNVDLRDRNLSSLPVQFESVHGDFYINDNQLVSLAGSPSYVEGSFICSDNRLKSLNGGPQEVEGSFFADGNRLKSLEGLAQLVGEDINISFNPLESLHGGPETVFGDFVCRDSAEISSEKLTLDGSPKIFLGNVDFSNTNLETLHGLGEVKGNLILTRNTAISFDEVATYAQHMEPRTTISYTALSYVAEPDGYKEDGYTEQKVARYFEPQNEKDVQFWLDIYGINGTTINADLSVDVHGDVHLPGEVNNSREKISGVYDKFAITFRNVSGNFDCGNLSTLEHGMPNYVGGDFVCPTIAGSSLSLVGSPKIVEGDFIARWSNIETLNGIGQVKGVLDIQNNPQLSLVEIAHYARQSKTAVKSDYSPEIVKSATQTIEQHEKSNVAIKQKSDQPTTRATTAAIRKI